MGRAIEELAHCVAVTPWEAIPRPVREHAKLVLLDTLGVILAGSVQPEVAGTRARLTATGGRGATVYAPGWPTTDPRTAEILLPLGGPKGSGLSFMFEMLASVLGAAPIQARVLGPERRRRHTSNLAVIAIDVAAFRPFGEFVSDADTLAGGPPL